MRKCLCFLIAFLCFFTLYADAQFTVRTIYFQPTDAPDKTAEVRKMMADVHEFYAKEMNRLIHVRKTFRIETKNNQIVVHTIRGKHPTAHYIADKTYNAISPEIPNVLKNKNNVHIIFVGGLQRINNAISGIASVFFGEVSGGYALIPADNMPFRVVIHELGHTFGLSHNLHGAAEFVMDPRSGHGGFMHYEARWLDKSHYFNDNHPAINAVPAIEKKHPIRVPEPRILQFKMDARSGNGIHQAEIARIADSGILDYDSLNGKRNITAAFQFNVRRLGNEHRLLLKLMDTHGNIWMEYTDIDIPPAAFLEPDPEKTTPLKPQPLKPAKPEPIKPEPDTEKPDPEKDLPHRVRAHRRFILLWAAFKR